MWDWIFKSPPAVLLWIGIFAGILACGLGIAMLPTVFQMIYGRPKVQIVLDNYTKDGWTIIRCKVFNHIISNRLLKLIGVNRRTAEDIVSHYRIVNRVSKTAKVDQVPFPKMARGGHLCQRISLPASEYPAMFDVIGRSESGEFAYYIKDKPQKISLEPGIYDMVIDVEVGDDKSYERIIPFRIVSQGQIPHWLFSKKETIIKQRKLKSIIQGISKHKFHSVLIYCQGIIA